jgi:regulator of RNase E activity RraA
VSENLPSREALADRLYAAVLSDVLDGMGLMSQAMRPFIRPLDDSLVMLGRARTGLYRPVYHVEPGSNPYAVEMALIDSLRPGEVAVFACDGPTERIAPWGELLTTASQVRGAVGCVTDGLVRDIRRIREMRFPVFHGGIGPLDSKGRGEMVAMDVPVELAGVRVEPGDWILGDADGVVVIPQAAAGEAFRQALAKVSAEDTTRDELATGASLAEVFARHGVL